jgi:LEA14-like dessication related protein
VLETNPTHAIMTIHILLQNPTPYTLHVEYLHVHLYHDDVMIGEAYVTDTTMLPGSRSRALTKATFLPHANNESKASVATFMKGYASGKKTVLEIRLHEKSIPSMPHLSKILAGSFAVKVAIPRLSPDDASNKILETNRPSEDFVPEDGELGSPSRGLESPIILSATMNILSSTVQLKIFNPLNVSLHVSNITAEASHNGSHIGDLNVPDDFHWTLEPGVQSTPKLHVTWSAISFGLDPKKSLNIVFDGWKRKGEISVDVKGKASVKMGNLELGEMETEVTGIATKIMI